MVSKFTDSPLDLSAPLSGDRNYQSTLDLLNPLSINAYSQSSSSDFANNLYTNSSIYLDEFADGKEEKRIDTVGDPNNPIDVFRFKITNDRTNIDISSILFSGAIDLQLIQDKNNNGIVDSPEEIISQSLHEGTSGHFIAEILNPGEYSIRVIPKNIEIVTGDIELRSTLLSTDFSQFDSFKKPTNIWRYHEGGRTERENSQGGTSNGIKSRKETILVIHGWNNNDQVDTVRELAFIS